MPDQFHLPREDVEIAQGVLDAAQEKAAAGRLELDTSPVENAIRPVALT
ncbi:MAG: hypothetical protein FD175_3085 [Beijerinckiaceae bacterium]|nr:MAG: hypothetical protein FD175_3085 [Beijerinckiaceae bacterium]